MIKSTTPINVISLRILSGMAHSSCIFHLTGSREFDNCESSRDWDFFTDGTCVTYLLNAGFEKLPGGTYPIGLCGILDIYRHKKAKIDVQIVDSVEKRRCIQKLFSIHELYNHDKITRGKLWRALYDAFSTGGDYGKLR